ncbi:MAG: S8 family peptidase, partial [Candidatus Limnocylindria bacterium]
MVVGVVPDRPLHAVAETLPRGIRRVDARHPTAADAHEAGHTGAGVAIGILDTGIDLNHPDLAVDLSRGLNCTGAGPPEDMHGHGTHVAGIAAATADNGIGVVGIAPEAVVVPIKVLDDTGEGTDSTVICGVDYLTGLATDGDPTNDVRIANLSLGEQGVIGHCQDGGLRQAICTSVEAGVTYVAAAGNSSIDAAEFIPAAYPEVVTVSALTDLDGEPGGLGGCYFFVLCDDDLAFFSNVGPIVDVIAPGVQILSTWKGDSYSTSDGTSMAAPHVAGVAALITAANPALAPADIERVLKAGGECPDGTWADGGSSEFDCQGQGSWDGDPDPEAEPLINALRSAQAAVDWDPMPSIAIMSPGNGDSVAGSVHIVVSAADDAGVTHVAFEVNGLPLSDDLNGSNGWSATWDTTGLLAGTYSISATAYDTVGQSASDTLAVNVGTNLQGDWVGSFGDAGYLLAGWESSTDLSVLPGVSPTLEQGARHRW